MAFSFTAATLAAKAPAVTGEIRLVNSQTKTSLVASARGRLAEASRAGRREIGYLTNTYFVL